jgi:hypothetical protein
MNEPFDPDLFRVCVLYADTLCTARVIHRDAPAASVRSYATELTAQAHLVRACAPASVAPFLDCIHKILEIDEVVTDANVVLQRAGVLP